MADTNWRTRHIDEPLGRRIMDLREAAGLNRKALAGLMRISPGALQHLEEGRNRFSAGQIRQICHLLKVEVSEAFEGLPTHVWSDRAAYEAWLSLRDPRARNQASASRPDLAAVAEEGAPFDHSGAGVRADLQALARSARNLSPEQVATLQMLIKGMKAS